jgi:hypothetical protein
MTKYWEKGIMKKSTQVKKKKTFKFICIKSYSTLDYSFYFGDIKSFMKLPDSKYWSLLNLDQPIEVNTPEVYY